MLDVEKCIIANHIMRGLTHAMASCLEGKVKLNVIPSWQSVHDWGELLSAADGLQDYCNSYGWQIAPDGYLLSDWLIDACSQSDN